MVLLSAGFLCAKKIEFPVPAYTKKEVKEIRKWEKEWVGKKINKHNLDQVKEFLSKQFYNVYKNPKEWGTDELWFEYKNIKT